MSADDLKAKLNAKAEAAEAQQQSFEDILKFKEKELPRLTREVYARIQKELSGVKNLTMVERPGLQPPAGFGAPELHITYLGKQIVFKPINERNIVSLGGRGKIEIRVDGSMIKESIVMSGAPTGPWEVCVFTQLNRQPYQGKSYKNDKLTDEVLTALLSNILGV